MICRCPEKFGNFLETKQVHDVFRTGFPVSSIWGGGGGGGGVIADEELNDVNTLEQIDSILNGPYLIFLTNEGSIRYSENKMLQNLSCLETRLRLLCR